MIDMMSTTFGTIYPAQTVVYSESQFGALAGVYPLTTMPPKCIYWENIYPHVAEFDSVISLFDNFREYTGDNNWHSMDDVRNDLSEGGRYRSIATNIYWFVGAPDTGGMGIGYDRTTRSATFYYIMGFYEDGGQIHADARSTTINYDPYELKNQPLPGGADEIKSLVPSNGRYQRGLVFWNEFRYNKESKSLGDATFHIGAMVTAPETTMSYTYKPPIGAYERRTFSWNEPIDLVPDVWNTNFNGDLPSFVGNTDALNPLWQTSKQEQIKISLYGGIELTPRNDYIEGTNILGGESGIIDIEGNPYKTDDTGGGGGGGYQFRYSESALPEGLPSLDLLNSGFVTLYNPTKAQLVSFSNFLFTGITDVASNIMKRLIGSPIDYILSLHMIHLPLSIEGATKPIGFCGVSSGVASNIVNKQYYEIEYRVEVQEFWNTALDYTNYTKLKIYVPYCGFYDLNIDEFQNGELFLHYVIDCVSGSCVAMVGTERREKDGTLLNSVLYQFSGNCILTMPITSNDWKSMFGTIVGIASTAIAPSPASVAGMAENIMGQKVSVQKSGNISSNYGYLGKQNPYIVIERPELSIPVDYGKHEGYPTNLKRKLINLRGYTEIKADTLIADGFTGTKEELEMLKTILERGVYL